MAGPEKLFETKLRRELDKRGHYTHKNWGGGNYTKAGIPDLFCSINGYFVAIEVKAERGKVAPLQTHQIGVINHAGAVAFTLRPSQWESFLEWLTEVEELQVRLPNWHG